MLSKFSEFIKVNKLILSNDKILLAVSGGADSVALTDLIYKFGANFGIAHCNFCLRSSESDEDENFVRNLAQKYKVPFYNIRFDTKNYASTNKLSIEEAARKLRYDWFHEICNQNLFTKIATGHHADDSLETFFINLTSGTGIRGICGIKPVNGIIVRPLLFSFRYEIELYCKNNKLDYRTDKTNFETIFIRNKFRHNIIPKFTEINPNFKSTLLNNIKIFKDVEKIYKAAIEKSKTNCLQNDGENIKININELQKTEAPETYLFEFINCYGFNSEVCKNIFKSLNSSSGKFFESQTHKLIKDREFLIITTKKSKIIDEFIIFKDDITINTPLPFFVEFIKKDNNFMIDKNPKIAFLDIEKLNFPLILRKWKFGDYFFPLGMKNKKLVSDFLINIKINIIEKENIFVLTSNNEIIWIVGLRIDDRFKLDNNSNNIYKISLKS